MFKILSLGVFLISSVIKGWAQDDLYSAVNHHYAFNDDVKLHYVTFGKGSPILFVHGFPDFWYTWRAQLQFFSEDYLTAAIDLRGYNLSDSPEGVKNYEYDHLVGDLVAVIKDLDHPVNLVAHDWGASIAWRLAIQHPDLVKKLVILSVPHPKAGHKAENSDNIESSYAERFVSDEFMNQLTEYWMCGWVTDPDAKPYYLEAFRRSDKEAMINYYRANFPTTENMRNAEFLKIRNSSLPNVKMPVLIIHGKEDPYLPVSDHNDTWDFIDNDLTIEVLSGVGHFIQQESGESLNTLIQNFLID